MELILDEVTYNNINNMSLKFDDKKISGIIGSRGSGKSSLVDIISGDFLPISGYVYLNGSIGVVYQNVIDQFFYDTISDEFIFYLKMNGVKNPLKKMNDALRIVGFNSNILNKSIYDLSLSEQKRVSLALVLSINPQIIILDDFFFGLDGKTRDNFIRLIRLLKVRYGKSIIITSSDSDLIYSICDSVFLIKNGSLVSCGDKYSIFTNKTLLSECFLSVPKIVQFSDLVLERKSVNIGYRDDINDLVKDIYRFVR